MAPVTTQDAARTAAALCEQYQQVRSATERLCEPLAIEDYVIQSMTDCSPAKWHLAHTTWFFEQFVLARTVDDYVPFRPEFDYLFNSYYVTLGERHCRPSRGLASRPTVAEIYDYRRHVDERMAEMLAQIDEPTLAPIRPVIELGLNHEQQHQELLITDIKHALWTNPLKPAYREREYEAPAPPPGPARWVNFDETLTWIGHDGEGFAFDNEGPRHRVFLDPYALASRPVTNAEFIAFMEDGGYRRPELWLSEAWALLEIERWEAPLYWERRDGAWWQFTLAGMRPVAGAEPVMHVSYFEADAYARWAGAWLPSESQWERAAAALPIEGNFAESHRFHPAALSAGVDGDELAQMFGDVWEWTSSAYLGYPGYRPAEGALGEYNGKFMCNRFVLRGGSCATPMSHIRSTYRNFFAPPDRWQFTGIRLARPR